MLDRVRQLDSAPTDPGMVAPAHLQRRILGQLLPRLGQFRLAAEHQPRHYQRLRPGAAFRQPALDKHLIDPAFPAHGSLLFMDLAAVSAHYRDMKPIYFRMSAAIALTFGLGAGAACAQQGEEGAAATAVQTAGEEDANWLDAPQTPGNWNYSNRAAQSIAQFGSAGSPQLFTMRCDKAGREIRLARSGTADGEIFVRIRAETADRLMPARNLPEGGMIAVSLPANDRLLDAIAITKGRFAVEAEGMAPLYIPAWAEVTRVIEDCR